MTAASLVFLLECAFVWAALRWARAEVRRMLRRGHVDPVLDGNPYAHVDALPDDPIVLPVLLRGELVGEVSIDRRTAVPTSTVLPAPPRGR